MKRKILIINILLALFSMICKAQDDDILIPVKIDGKMGYVNMDGKIVISPKYDKADRFYENGFASVWLDGKSGVIDRSGRVVIDLKYEGTASWGSEYVTIGVDKKCGLIDLKGNVILEPKYDFVYPSVSAKGIIPVVSGGKLGFVDKTGKFVVEPQYYCRFGEYSKNGLAWISKDDKYGFVNRDGNLVIDLLFDDAKDFTDDGLAIVKIGGKAGYIDASGNYVVKPQYEIAADFINGFSHVGNGDGYAVINKKGELVTGFNWRSIGDFSKEGIAWVEEQGDNYGVGAYGYIDNTGEYVLGSQYESAISFQANGLAAVKLFGSWSIVKYDGEKIDFLPVDDFDEVVQYPIGVNGVICVRKGDELGIINRQGKYVPIPQCEEVGYLGLD